MDTYAPQIATFTINNGAAKTYAADGLVTLGLFAADYQGGSGVAQMRIGRTYAEAASGPAIPELYQTSKTWALGEPWVGLDEMHTATLWVAYVDFAGNWSTPVSDSIVYDRADPVGTIAFTDTRTDVELVQVGFTFDADVVDMKLSRGNACAGGDWVDAENTQYWSLLQVDGLQELSVRFRDDVGNESACYYDSITRDTAGPVPTSFTMADASGNSQAGYADETNLVINASSATGDCSGWELAEDIGFITVTASGAGCTLVNQPYVLVDTSEGTHNLYLRFLDDLGNVGNMAAYSVVLDTDAPFVMAGATGAFTIVQGMDTNSTSIQLDIAVIGATQIAVEEGWACTSNSWATLNDPYNFSLSSGDGWKPVSARFKDEAGNILACHTETINLDTYIDPTWLVVARDISTHDAKTNSSLVEIDIQLYNFDGFVEYQISSNSTFAGSTWEPSDGTGLFSAGAGYDLNWDVGVGDGIKNIYMRVRDRAGNTSSSIGSIELDTTPPDAPALQLIDTTGDGYALSEFSAELQWSLPAGSNSFELQRLISSIDTDFVTIASPSNPTANYTDTIAYPGKLYQYRIRAIDDIGNASAWSVVVQARPFTPISEVAYIRSLDDLKYVMQPATGTFELAPTYEYSNVTDDVFYDALPPNQTEWIRPTPEFDYFDELLNIRTKNSDGSLVFESQVPLELNFNEVLDDCNIFCARFLGVAVDSRDALHVSYYGGSYLSYYTNKTGSWVKTVLDSSNGTSGWTSAIAVDAQDNVHMLYYHLARKEMKYTTNSGIVVNDNFAPPITTDAWASYTAGAEISALAYNEPSNALSLNLDGGGDIVESIDLTAFPALNYSYYFERQGAGEMPDAGDFLYFEYYNGTAWTTLQTHGNTSGSNTTFTLVSGTLPANATKVRFRSVGSGEGFDDYFVDDFKLSYSTGTWLTWVVDDYQDGVGGKDFGTSSAPSISVGPDGMVHMTYFADTDDDLRYAYRKNGIPVGAFTVDNSVGIMGEYSSVEGDSGGVARVIYSGGSTLKYAYGSKSSWTRSTLDATRGNYPDLTRTPTGELHAVYSGTGGLFYRYTVAGTWQAAVNLSAETYWHAGIAVDETGYAHVSAQYYGLQAANDLDYFSNRSGSFVRRKVQVASDVGYYARNVIDRRGRVHALHANETIYALVHSVYAEPSSKPWKDETLSTSANYDPGTVVQLDAQGFPHIAYVDGNDLYFKTYAYGTWTNLLVDSVSSVAGELSMVLDSSGYAHIAYYDQTATSLKYAIVLPSGGSANVETVDTTENAGYYNGITVSTTGVVSIIYSNQHVTCCTYNVKRAYGSFGSWATESLSTGSNFQGFWVTEILADASGKLHALYYDGNSTQLTYRVNTAGTWGSTQSVSVGGLQMYVGMAVDNSGNVHTSSYDYSNAKLVYRFRNAGTGLWTSTDVDTDGAAGEYTDLVLDGNGKAHISYRRGTTLRYATNIGGFWMHSTIDDDGDAGHSSSIAMDKNGKQYITHVDRAASDLKMTSGYLSGVLQADTVSLADPF